MVTILWIIIFGLLMCVIALAGWPLLWLGPKIVDKMILPLVAFSAGSLVGGAFFHMIPHAVTKMGNETKVYVWLMAGLVLFLGLEQFLNWHHSHTHSHNFEESGGNMTCSHENCMVGNGTPKEMDTGDHHKNDQPGVILATTASSSDREIQQNEDNEDVEQQQDKAEDNSTRGDPSFHEARQPTESTHANKTLSDNHTVGETDGSSAPTPSPPAKQKHSLGYLILLADAVHNFLGGLFVGASFVESTSLGVSAWLAAAFHEFPQELGDFAILVHGGWTPKEALRYNFLSATTFPIGGLVAYASSQSIDISFLIPFAAGNFIYIGASDLIPEIKHHHGKLSNILHFCMFLLGAGTLLAIRIAVNGW